VPRHPASLASRGGHPFWPFSASALPAWPSSRSLCSVAAITPPSSPPGPTPRLAQHDCSGSGLFDADTATPLPTATAAPASLWQHRGGPGWGGGCGEAGGGSSSTDSADTLSALALGPSRAASSLSMWTPFGFGTRGGGPASGDEIVGSGGVGGAMALACSASVLPLATGAATRSHGMGGAPLSAPPPLPPLPLAAGGAADDLSSVSPSLSHCSSSASSGILRPGNSEASVAPAPSQAAASTGGFSSLLAHRGSAGTGQPVTLAVLPGPVPSDEPELQAQPTPHDDDEDEQDQQPPSPRQMHQQQQNAAPPSPAEPPHSSQVASPRPDSELALSDTDSEAPSPLDQTGGSVVPGGIAAPPGKECDTTAPPLSSPPPVLAARHTAAAATATACEGHPSTLPPLPPLRPYVVPGPPAGSPTMEALARVRPPFEAFETAWEDALRRGFGEAASAATAGPPDHAAVNPVVALHEARAVGTGHDSPSDDGGNCDEAKARPDDEQAAPNQDLPPMKGCHNAPANSGDAGKAGARRAAALWGEWLDLDPDTLVRICSADGLAVSSEADVLAVVVRLLRTHRAFALPEAAAGVDAATTAAAGEGAAPYSTAVAPLRAPPPMLPPSTTPSLVAMARSLSTGERVAPSAQTAVSNSSNSDGAGYDIAEIVARRTALLEALRWGALDSGALEALATDGTVPPELMVRACLARLKRVEEAARTGRSLDTLAPLRLPPEAVRRMAG